MWLFPVEVGQWLQRYIQRCSVRHYMLRVNNKHWAHSCHEFRFYEKLLIDVALPVVPAKEVKEDDNTPSDATVLIRRAIARLSQNKGDPWVLKSGIRPMVKRIDSTFDEKT